MSDAIRAERAAILRWYEGNRLSRDEGPAPTQTELDRGQAIIGIGCLLEDVRPGTATAKTLLLAARLLRDGARKAEETP